MIIPAKGLPALVGNTPLVRLAGPSEATGCEIYGKCEFMNPGGSVKDRAALFIIEDAEANGTLAPGGLIFLTAPSRGHVHDQMDCWRYYPDSMRALAAFARLKLKEAHTDLPPRKPSCRLCRMMRARWPGGKGMPHGRLGRRGRISSRWIGDED